MIQSKSDLVEYLEADKRELGRRSKHPGFFDFVWKFEICMRKREYYLNCAKNPLWGVVKMYLSLKYQILSVLCGFTIPLNSFGKGLSIAHRGTIVVNGGAQIGNNCRLHVGVNIGTAPGLDNAAPIIGNDVYIAPGVKIYGRIHISDGIIVGANAVVTKSFDEPNICIAGVPAQKISDNGRYEVEERNRRIFPECIRND
jgi:serine O-acetyltransferase